MTTDAVRNATASASDSLWQERARKDPEVQHTDPRCRFAKRDPEHRCVDAFGRPIRAEMPCHIEARAQVHDEAQRQFAEASGLPVEEDA